MYGNAQSSLSVDACCVIKILHSCQSYRLSSELPHNMFPFVGLLLPYQIFPGEGEQYNSVVEQLLQTAILITDVQNYTAPQILNRDEEKEVQPLNPMFSPLYVKASEYLFYASKATVFTQIAVDKTEEFPNVNIGELALYADTTPSSVTKFCRIIG